MHEDDGDVFERRKCALGVWISSHHYLLPWWVGHDGLPYKSNNRFEARYKNAGVIVSNFP